MNPRKLTIVGLPIVLIGALVWFLVFQGPDTGYGTGQASNPGRSADEIEAEGRRETTGGATASDAAGTRGLGRESLVDEEAEFEAMLSGFTGRLVDHESRPLPERVVRFYRIDGEVLQVPALFAQGDDESVIQVKTHEGRTNAEGRFEVTGAWPSSFYILEADAEGDHRLTQIVDRTPGSGEIIDLGDIRLELLGTIVGRIVDEDGKGVPGVMIAATDIPSAFVQMAAPAVRFDPEGAVIIREEDVRLVIEMPGFAKRYFDLLIKPRTLTDSEGAFRLTGVQPRENALFAVKRSPEKSFIPKIKPGIRVKAGKEKKVGNIELEEGEEAFVKVVDTEGEPVPGAEILLAATTKIFEVDFASRVGKTDAEGKLSATGFPDGKVTAAARRSRSDPWVIAEPTYVGDDVVIKLPGRHHFDLSVLSAVGQEIVGPEFKLMPSAEEGIPLAAGAMGVIKWLDIKDKIEQLEDGRYRIADLIPGKYTLAVTASGHGAAKIDFKIEKSSEGKITLPPQTMFRVRVVDNFGETVRRARVYMLSRKPDSGEKLMEMPIVAGVTDKKGELVVRDGEAGTIRLSASHPAHGYAHAEAKIPSADPIVLTMDLPGVLSGVLTENGRPPMPGKWTIIVSPLGRGERGAMPDLPKFTSPDLEGNFGARGLRPGKYRINVMKSLTALTSPGGIIGFVMRQELMQDHVKADVTIEPGKPTFIELEAIKQTKPVDGPSARVSGTVLINGRAGKGMMVTARGKQRFGVTADASGRFDFGQVPVGTLRVSVRDGSEANVFDLAMENHLWRDRIEIADGKDVLLDIHVRTGRIAGIVRMPSGEPVSGVPVKARGSRVIEDRKRAQTSSSLTVTDTNGRFSFDNLPAGNYRLEVDAEQRGHGSVDKLELQPSGVLVGVSISLSKVFVATGRLDMSAFGKEPPRWSYLEFTRNGSDSGHGASVRRDGKFRARGLPPGEYQVKVHVPQKDNRGSRELETTPTVVVFDKDLTDIVLTPRVVPETQEKAGGSKRDRSGKNK